MRKYWEITKISWENGFAYRISVLMWRLRQFLSTLMALTLWTVVFSGTQSAFAYNQNEMITYIFLAAFLQSAILTTNLNGLARTVYSGELSIYLVRPMHLFATFASMEIADKLKNIGFLIIETILLFLIFQPNIVAPSLSVFLIFLAWTIGGVVLVFFINLLFGALGFWSPDVWGPRFLFFLFISFTAGKLFPIDILPAIIQKIIFLTPLPYFTFMQTQLFIGRLDPSSILQHSIVLFAWIFILWLLARWVWKRGIINYSAVGQ